MLDLDQVRLSKVRRELRKLKLRSEGTEINEIKFSRCARARRKAVREGETDLAHLHNFESDLSFLREIALIDQGPVVQKAVNANLGLNLPNLGLNFNLRLLCVVQS